MRRDWGDRRGNGNKGGNKGGDKCDNAGGGGFWVRQGFAGNKGGDNKGEKGGSNKGEKGSDKKGGNAGIVERGVRFRRVLWKCASPADRERERDLCC